METAKFDRKTITIISDDNSNHFKCSGSTIKFDGFLKLTKIDNDEDQKILPEVKKKLLILINLLMNNILHSPSKVF